VKRVMKNSSFVIRFLTGAGAFALVGMLVTGAIAWTCAMSTTGQHAGGRRIQLSNGSITLEQFQAFGMERIDWFAVKGRDTEERKWELPAVYPAWVPGWSMIHTMTARDMGESGAFQTSETAYGWPMLAFHSTTRSGWAIDWKSTSSARGLTTDDQLASTSSLSILWRGFAINTLIFGACPWLIFFAPFQLRSAIRARRGLCPYCAYPVGLSDVCTECGKPLPHQVSVANERRTA
jgi:hypothetical protein